MADLKKVASHFKQYWDAKGVKKGSTFYNNIDAGIQLFAAEVPPMKTAPEKSQNVQQEQSPVLESVEDLGGTVENEVEKKMNLQVRRVIEDAVRRYLGPVFQELEKAIKPQVEKEVAEQSKDVKQDIKQVVPAIANVEDKAAPVPEAPLKEPKEMPKPIKEAPVAPLKEAASLEKKAAQARIDIAAPNLGTVEDFENKFGVEVEPDLVNNRWSIVTDNPTPITEFLQSQGADWKVTDTGSEIFPITQEIPLTDVQPVEVLASAPEEKPIESISNLTNTTREEIRVSGQEEKDMLRIAYHQGETFEKSYFVATDGKDVKVVSAIRVIPADVQLAIKAAEEKGEEAKDILSPEEAAAEIEKECAGTIDGFVAFTQSLPKLTREADLKREAEWAINEGEITKVDMPKKGEVIMSVKEEEKEDTDLPSGKSSKVKSYYGRLPSQAVGGQEQAINQQSSVNDKYNILRKALDEEKAKVENLSKEKAKMGDELGKLKEEKSVGQKKSSVSSIMGALKKLGPVDPETEKTAVDMLVKVDEKALSAILDVLKLVGGDDGKGEAPMFGGAPKLEAPKGPAMPPISKPKSPMASINGINLPQIGSSSETTSLIDVVSKMMDH